MSKGAPQRGRPNIAQHAGAARQLWKQANSWSYVVVKSNRVCGSVVSCGPCSLCVGGMFECFRGAAPCRAG